MLTSFLQIVVVIVTFVVFVAMAKPTRGFDALFGGDNLGHVYPVHVKLACLSEIEEPGCSGGSRQPSVHPHH